MRVKAFEKLEQYSEALDFMNEYEKDLIDKHQKEDIFGRLFAARGFTEKAIDHFKSMLEINPNNYDTYYKILKAMDFKLFDEFGNV